MSKKLLYKKRKRVRRTREKDVMMVDKMLLGVERKQTITWKVCGTLASDVRRAHAILQGVMINE